MYRGYRLLRKASDKGSGKLANFSGMYICKETRIGRAHCIVSRAFKLFRERWRFMGEMGCVFCERANGFFFQWGRFRATGGRVWNQELFDLTNAET